MEGLVSFWFIFAKLLSKGKDAVKLTAKRIINELGVAKFQGEYLNISFWEL